MIVTGGGTIVLVGAGTVVVPLFVPRPGVVPEAGVPGPGGDVPGVVVALVPVGGGVPGGTAVGAAGSGTGVGGAGSTVAVVGGGGSAPAPAPAR